MRRILVFISSSFLDKYFITINTKKNPGRDIEYINNYIYMNLRNSYARIIFCYTKTLEVRI